MRVLEVAGTTGLLLSGLLLTFCGERNGSVFLVVPVALVIGLHILREGWRLQMYPAYFSTIVLIIYQCQHWLSGDQAQEVVAAIISLSSLAAFIACIAMPVFELPRPSGPYKVGTQTRHIVDESRKETNADNPNASRELIIQIWFPAEPGFERARRSSYRDKPATTPKSAHFALVKTHAALDVPISKTNGPFPVLLYTPSWSGVRTECTIQVEEMASHGYVVVAVDHPYSSAVVAFPDGRVVHRRFSGDENYKSDESVTAFGKVADEQIRLRADDVRFVLNVLEDWNGNDPDNLLTGALSPDRAGVFGFSLGGGTAAQVCAVDRRFKAGLDMGGMIAGEAIGEGTFAPFFFMFEGAYECYPYSVDASVRDLSPYKLREVKFTQSQFAQMKKSLAKSGGYWMSISGIRHQDFSDAPYFSPLRRILLDREKVTRIVSESIRGFFDKHLKNLDRPSLEDQISEFPEVRFEVWKPAATRSNPG